MKVKKNNGQIQRKLVQGIKVTEVINAVSGLFD
jgi:hypothetical protein